MSEVTRLYPSSLQINELFSKNKNYKFSLWSMWLDIYCPCSHFLRDLTFVPLFPWNRCIFLFRRAPRCLILIMANPQGSLTTEGGRSHMNTLFQISLQEYLTLTFDSNVILVIWNPCCHQMDLALCDFSNRNTHLTLRIPVTLFPFRAPRPKDKWTEPIVIYPTFFSKSADNYN